MSTNQQAMMGVSKSFISKSFSEPKKIREESKSKESFDNDLLEGFRMYPTLDGTRETTERLANDLMWLYLTGHTT